MSEEGPSEPSLHHDTCLQEMRVLIDGRSLADRDRIESDLCIVGCGPAGITIARQVARPGLRLVMVESGGLERDRRADRLGAGERAGHPYAALENARARGIGGTSLHWEMRETGGDEGWLARPLDPIDFEPREAIPNSGWPITLQQLDPYYRRAQAVSALGPYAYEPADWPEDLSSPFALADDVVVTKLFQRGDQRFNRFRAELEASPDIRVIHNATVLELVSSDDASEVRYLIVATGRDRRVTVSARQFVLAAGGIENPRLLLVSRGARSGGLGNGHDLVGRFFMERLSGRAGVLVPNDAAVVAASGLYESHVVNGTRLQGALSLAPNLVQREGLRNSAFWVKARPRSSSAQGVQSLISLYRMARWRPFRPRTMPAHVVSVARDLPEVARTAAHVATGNGRAADVFQLGVQAEQAPGPDSRVTLGTGRDRFGQPVPRLDWRPSEADRASIVRSVELLDGALRRARIGRIIRKFGQHGPEPLYVANFHHMGGTRMAADPTHGVVDANGRVHSVRNLYVAGSSVFPTAGFANPTLTIVALALRLADFLQAMPWGDFV